MRHVNRINISKETKVVASISVIAVLFLSSSIGVLPHVSGSSSVATLSGVAFSPAINIVGFNTYYDVRFTVPSPAESIDNVSITFASGYNIANMRFVNSIGIANTGKTFISGQTFTYQFAKSPTKVAAGTLVIIETSNVVNPSTAGSYTGTIETLNDTTVVASGTSSSYSLGQISGSQIASGTITSSNLASSITITALSAGTLSVSGTSSFTGAATFASTVTSTGLLTANGGIKTTTLSASGAATFAKTVTTTGLLTANGGVDTSTITGASGLTLNTGTGNLVALTSSHEELEFGNSFFCYGNSTITPCDYTEITASGSICNGVGSTPCGGVFELDAPGGSFYAANGAFAVSTSGQITTNSVGFQSFDNFALPDGWGTGTSTGQDTPTFAPGRDAYAMVFITVDVQGTSTAAEVSVTLNTNFTGVSILPESVHGFYLPANAEQSVTYEYLVTGFTASTLPGWFQSELATCSVGPACGGNSWNSAYAIYDNMINVVWLPA